MKTQFRSVKFLISLILLASNLIASTDALGRPAGPGNTVGEYGPQNTPPKPYAFNYEVTDEHGNTHYRREQGDPSGIVTGSYGYMNVNGLYRMVEYMADAGGYKVKIKTNEPGAKGPGSADVELQADPVPPGLAEMFERKAPAVPAGPVSPSRPNFPGPAAPASPSRPNFPGPAAPSRPSYPGMKG